MRDKKQKSRQFKSVDGQLKWFKNLVRKCLNNHGWLLNAADCKKKTSVACHILQAAFTLVALVVNHDDGEDKTRTRNADDNNEVLAFYV